MTRCVRTILKVLQNITPESEVDIHLQLSSIESSMNFAPPEMDQLHWARIAEAYDSVTNPPEEGWQLFLCAILNDEPVERLRTEIEAYNLANPKA